MSREGGEKEGVREKEADALWSRELDAGLDPRIPSSPPCVRFYGDVSTPLCTVFFPTLKLSSLEYAVHLLTNDSSYEQC